MWRRRRRREKDLLDKIQGRARRSEEECIPFPDDLNYSFYSGMLEFTGKSQKVSEKQGPNSNFHMLHKRGQASKLRDESGANNQRQPRTFSCNHLLFKNPSFTQMVAGQNYKKLAGTPVSITADKPQVEHTSNLAFYAKPKTKPIATISPSPAVSTEFKSVERTSMKSTGKENDTVLNTQKNRNVEQANVVNPQNVALTLMEKEIAKESVPSERELVESAFTLVKNEGQQEEVTSAKEVRDAAVSFHEKENTRNEVTSAQELGNTVRGLVKIESPSGGEVSDTTEIKDGRSYLLTEHTENIEFRIGNDLGFSENRKETLLIIKDDHAYATTAVCEFPSEVIIGSVERKSKETDLAQNLMLVSSWNSIFKKEQSPVEEESMWNNGSFQSSVLSEPPFPLTQKHISNEIANKGGQMTDLQWSPADLLFDKEEELVP